MNSLLRGKAIEACPGSIKVMLHRDDLQRRFSSQHSVAVLNNVATILNNVATML